MDLSSLLSDPHLAYLMPIMGALTLVFVLIYIIPFWMIFKKAGFTPWLALLLFVPLANVIILYVLAFSRWKVAPVAQLVDAAYPPAIYPPAAPPPSHPADPNDRT